ncbi:hypothetical protein KXW16_002578, partial [Aspergillus fumigatus]
RHLCRLIRRRSHCLACLNLKASKKTAEREGRSLLFRTIPYWYNTAPKLLSVVFLMGAKAGPC